MPERDSYHSGVPYTGTSHPRFHGTRDWSGNGRFERQSHIVGAVADEVLFSEGDRDFCFYVVIEGAIEFTENSSGTPRIVATPPAGFPGMWTC